MFDRKLTILATLVLPIGITVAGVGAQTIVYVDDDASAGGDGATWTTAYKYIQDALIGAPSGTEIRVAGGTYKPDEGGGVTPGRRAETFLLITGVALYGGYRGCPGGDCGGGDPDERNIAEYETILSGDLNEDDAPIECTTDAQCVSFGRRCVDNFCLIHDNHAENSRHVVTGSGTDGTAVLNGFTITAGYADGAGSDGNGGGMFNHGGSPTVANCTFRRNTCRNCGGGMCNYTDGSPSVINCRFIGNYAPDCGGGQVNYPSSNATLTNCAFIGNVAGDQGGGIAALASPTLVNCLFTGNWAKGSATGDGDGDGGGGVALQDSQAEFINCVFSENSADEDGGGLAAVNSYPILKNCILWGNVDDADENSGGPYMDESAQIDIETGTPVVTYSCVQDDDPNDASIPFGGVVNGNVDDDPLFVDADGPDDIPGTEDDDLHLSYPGSACIDAGDNTAVPPDVADLDNDGNTAEQVPFDLDGNVRIVNRVVDMGAYEFLYEGIPAVSEWGLVAMTLLVLAVGTVVLVRRRVGQP